MISGKAKNIKQLFDKLLENNKDIIEVILLSYEGLTMVSTMETGITEDSISVMAAKINMIIINFFNELKWGKVSHFMIVGDKKYIVIKEIKEIGLLVVLTTKDNDRDRVFSHIDSVISAIRSFKDEN